MAARRNHRRRDWPTGLYEPTPGYYVFRWTTPEGERRQETIGRVPYEFARDEALAARAHLSARKPSLVARIMGATNTMAALQAKMPKAANKNTLKTNKTHERVILEKLGADTQVSSVTVADCAKVLEELREAGHERTAQAVRSRMSVMFKRAMALGWVERNPVDPTEAPQPKVKRDRLTLEQFKLVLSHAEGWLPQAMLLLLVTGQDRETVTRMHTDMLRYVEGQPHLIVQRNKTKATNQPVAIPLDLSLGEWSLRSLVERVPAGYLVAWEDGTPVHVNRVSKRFREARVRAGIPDVMPNGQLAPTFYEIKSLAKRLYKAQGNVDTQHLFSHRDKRTDELYADPRGVEPIIVRIKA